MHVQGMRHAERADGIEKSKQDAATGGWAVPAQAGKPAMPAITGLVVTGMLDQPGADPKDEAPASSNGRKDLRAEAMATPAVQAVLEVFPADIKDVEEL